MRVSLRFPWLTLVALIPTVVLTVVSDAHPAVLAALRRDPHALRAGQWWRVLSPVLVQPDPVAVTILVFLMVAVVGILSERVFSRRAWVALYLVGAVVGHAAGDLWQPHGAGCSVAGCGLLGGLVAVLLLRGPRPAQIGATAWLLFAVVDTFLRDNHGLPLLAGAGLGVWLARRGPAALVTARR